MAHELEYPFANDLWRSSTWQASVKRKDKIFGKRSVQSFLYRPEFELYDLNNDPDEIKNLADNSEYSEILKKLKQKLKKFQQDTNDPWVVKWEHQ